MGLASGPLNPFAALADEPRDAARHGDGPSTRTMAKTLLVRTTRALPLYGFGVLLVIAIAQILTEAAGSSSYAAASESATEPTVEATPEPVTVEFHLWIGSTGVPLLLPRSK